MVSVNPLTGACRSDIIPLSMLFQEIILTLHKFWSRQGCVILQGYDVEKGAGTFHPATFLRALGKKPWRCAYVEPTRRPTDGRYGENPNRLQHYYQYQVILKPAPDEAQKIYLKSLAALGLSPKKHDIRFMEDDWESPTLGATGVGWEVWCDGMEISQFTYFQQMGGVPLDPISLELTYGLERIAMYLQRKNSVYELLWDRETTYGEIHQESERQFSRYNFEEAPKEKLNGWFEEHHEESRRLLGLGLALPAYEHMMKCSHFFNLLDARGAISVESRQKMISSVRELSVACAGKYLESEK